MRESDSGKSSVGPLGQQKSDGSLMTQTNNSEEYKPVTIVECRKCKTLVHKSEEKNTCGSCGNTWHLICSPGKRHSAKNHRKFQQVAEHYQGFKLMCRSCYKYMQENIVRQNLLSNKGARLTKDILAVKSGNEIEEYHKESNQLLDEQRLNESRKRKMSQIHMGIILNLEMESSSLAWQIQSTETQLGIYESYLSRQPQRYLSGIFDENTNYGANEYISTHLLATHTMSFGERYIHEKNRHKIVMNKIRNWHSVSLKSGHIEASSYQMMGYTKKNAAMRMNSLIMLHYRKNLDRLRRFAHRKAKRYKSFEKKILLLMNDLTMIHHRKFLDRQRKSVHRKAIRYRSTVYRNFYRERISHSQIKMNAHRKAKRKKQMINIRTIACGHFLSTTTECAYHYVRKNCDHRKAKRKKSSNLVATLKIDTKRALGTPYNPSHLHYVSFGER